MMPGDRRPGLLLGDRAGSTFAKKVEPTGIEPVTSCLQTDVKELWKSADLEDLYW
jgi:hypothetical protein